MRVHSDSPLALQVATSRRRAEESEGGRSCLVGASTAPSLPVKMSSVSCATLNRSKSVFVGGGEDGSFQDVLTTVYQLDSGSDRWTELPPCSEPVAYFSLAAAGDQLHMLGGMYSSNKRPAGAGTISQSVYTLGQDGEWACRLPPMTIPRCSAGATGHGQLVVIAGGSSLKGRTASVEAIHLGSSNPHWVQLPPLPQVLDSPQVVITGERLLVGLGCTESGVANTTLYEASLADVRTHMLQPSRRQKGNVFWRVLCSVPLKMAALSSCMGTVVAVGCERDSREQNASVLAYSSNKQVWDCVVRLPSARSKAGIVSLEGPSPSLMVLGGCSREKGSIREVDIVHLQPLQ